MDQTKIDRLAQSHIDQIMWWVDHSADYRADGDREFVLQAVELHVREAIRDGIRQTLDGPESDQPTDRLA